MGSGYWAGSGLTRRGVTTNTSSVWSCWKLVLRARAPITGSSPMPGMALRLPVTLFLISPPMAKLWPSCTCSVVEARRVVMSGRIDVLLLLGAVTATPVGESSDTSGETFRLMRPFSITVGVKRRPTPKVSSCRMMVATPLVAAPCATGMNTLPPARKLASCPLMAIRLGSASTLTSPSPFCASNANLSGKWLFLLKFTMSFEPDRKLASAPKVQLPKAPLTLSAEPIWSIRVLETSATFTSSITCCGASTAIMLMMRGLRGGAPGVAPRPCMAPPPCAAPPWSPCAGPRVWRMTKALAMSSTFCACTESLTLPPSTRLSAAAETCTFLAPGISVRRVDCSPPGSAPTDTSITLHEPLRPCTIMLVVPTSWPSR